MTAWVLDTNVLSELRRPRPEPRVVAFISTLPLDSLYVTTVTLAELRFGIELLADPVRRAELTTWLTNVVRPMFLGRVLELSEDILVEWRLLIEEGRKVGHTYSQPDLLIAATARQHGMIVVSRDTSHYERANAAIFNPWTAESLKE